MYCRVIVDIVHENVARPFTYMIPDSMKLSAGQRVKVPFGSREKEGIVVEVTADCDVDSTKVRNVIRPLEEYAAIPPELMDLAHEIALQDHCPMAVTLRLMLPSQMRGGRVRVKTVRTVRLAVPDAEARIAMDADKRKGNRFHLLEILLDRQERSENWRSM